MSTLVPDMPERAWVLDRGESGNVCRRHASQTIHGKKLPRMSSNTSVSPASPRPLFPTPLWLGQQSYTPAPQKYLRVRGRCGGSGNGSARVHTWLDWEMLFSIAD